jgi:DNA-binding XRE family transcriptional regulator
MGSEIPPHYVRVWQTWDLVSPRTQSHCSNELEISKWSSVDVDGAIAKNNVSPLSLRHKVQHARIERRLSIAALASEVMCAPETIAAFERGDGVLGADVRARIFKCLKLS